ncbi:MAG TPA: hypothetical protein VG917_04390 [Patescibacteria group bacterium]|nr:hypothetical protein [Patescibacteria group bacterium]
MPREIKISDPYLAGEYLKTGTKLNIRDKRGYPLMKVELGPALDAEHYCHTCGETGEKIIADSETSNSLARSKLEVANLEFTSVPTCPLARYKDLDKESVQSIQSDCINRRPASKKQVELIEETQIYINHALLATDLGYAEIISLDTERTIEALEKITI